MQESDPTSDEFHKWVGYYITTWAKVEKVLFELCWQSLKASKERTAIVYFKTPSIEARISLTDELVRTVLPKTKSGEHHHPDLIAWDELRKKIISHLATRRRIAHHPVRAQQTIIEDSAVFGGTPFGQVSFGGGGGSDGDRVISWWELYVSENEQLRGKNQELMPLFTNDIRAHGYLLIGLADALTYFYVNGFLKHV